jgi:secondary thiamine-phosphate synthase enzyme
VKSTSVFCDSLVVELGVGPDLIDITHRLDGIVKRSPVVNGVLYATVVGSTGSITTIEYEPGAVTDLKDAIERLAPKDIEYAHEEAWHDGNGHSHVQAALIGSSIAVAVRNGKLCLGTWQQVVAINHDNRPRRRPIEVTVTGTIG